MDAPLPTSMECPTTQLASNQPAGTQITHLAPRPLSWHPDHQSVTQLTHLVPRPPSWHPDHPSGTQTTQLAPRLPVTKITPLVPRPPIWYPDYPVGTHSGVACYGALGHVPPFEFWKNINGTYGSVDFLRNAI